MGACLEFVFLVDGPGEIRVDAFGGLRGLDVILLRTLVHIHGEGKAIRRNVAMCLWSTPVFRNHLRLVIGAMVKAYSTACYHGNRANLKPLLPFVTHTVEIGLVLDELPRQEVFAIDGQLQDKRRPRRYIPFPLP